LDGILVGWDGIIVDNYAIMNAKTPVLMINMAYLSLRPPLDDKPLI
jgi:hypothetical protein